MTKQEFLRRCETAYDMGFFNDRTVSSHMAHALDAYLRLRHVIYAYKNDPVWDRLRDLDYQAGTALNALIGYGVIADFEPGRTLAGDPAYEAARCAAVLDHPRQKCAENPRAWHTRYGFCEHKEQPTA